MRLYDYGPSPNCHKVRILLAQLGRDYERVPTDIFGGDTLRPDYLEKNPGLTTPVLEIEPGVYLPESGAILLYLAEGTELLPDDPIERAHVHRWMMYEQARLFAIVGALRFFVLTGRIDPESREARQQLRFSTAAVGQAESHLASHDFFVGGRYTVADVALYGYLQVAHEAGVEMGAFPNVGAWLDRVREQPGHVADLEPYPENAQVGRSRSIYDLVIERPAEPDEEVRSPRADGATAAG
ncbi:MAG TPA: glutathione S-transferase family protein [Thermoleophilaceae bacterium]|jgi:glutathione S-transferase